VAERAAAEREARAAEREAAEREAREVAERAARELAEAAEREARAVAAREAREAAEVAERAAAEREARAAAEAAEQAAAQRAERDAPPGPADPELPLDDDEPGPAATPRWEGLGGVRGDESRMNEKGPGKWTLQGRSREELAGQLPPGESRPMDLASPPAAAGVSTWAWAVAAVAAFGLLAWWASG
jgi:hypothetical protein